MIRVVLLAGLVALPAVAMAQGWPAPTQYFHPYQAPAYQAPTYQAPEPPTNYQSLGNGGYVAPGQHMCQPTGNGGFICR
jgi:hypothetical protein